MPKVWEGMKTYNAVFDAVAVYRNRVRLNQTILPDDIIQTEDDFKNAIEIMRYLQNGSYLPNSKKGQRCRKVVKIYRRGSTVRELADATGFAYNIVRSYGDIIEGSLNSKFNKPMIDYWSARQFKVILDTLGSIDNFELSKALGIAMEDYEQAFKPSTLKSSLDLDEGIAELRTLEGDEYLKFKENITKCLDVMKAIDDLQNEPDILMDFAKVKKALKYGLYVPAEIRFMISTTLGISTGGDLDEDLDESV